MTRRCIVVTGQLRRPERLRQSLHDWEKLKAEGRLDDARWEATASPPGRRLIVCVNGAWVHDLVDAKLDVTLGLGS
jgi:hypothetical protein